MDVIFYLEAKVFYLIYSEELIKLLQAAYSEQKQHTCPQIQKIQQEIDGLFMNDKGPFKNGNPWRIKTQMERPDLQTSPESLKCCYLYKLAKKISSSKMNIQPQSRTNQLSRDLK
jgi:hypothetical protein